MLSTADFWFPLSAHPLSLDRIARIEGVRGCSQSQCIIHAMNEWGIELTCM